MELTYNNIIGGEDNSISIFWIQSKEELINLLIRSIDKLWMNYGKDDLLILECTEDILPFFRNSRNIVEEHGEDNDNLIEIILASQPIFEEENYPFLLIQNYFNVGGTTVNFIDWLRID